MEDIELPKAAREGFEDGEGAQGFEGVVDDPQFEDGLDG